MAQTATLSARTQAPTVLTRRQLATRWQCSERSIDNWTREGLIECTRLGRNVRFRLDEVERCERSGIQG